MLQRWQQELAAGQEPMSDQAFYRLVRRHGRLAGEDEARSVTRQVFASLAAGLDERLVGRLVRCLPPTPAADLDHHRRLGPAAPDTGLDRELFIGPLVNAMDTVGRYDETLGGMDLVTAYLDDDAAMRTQAVFVAVKACCGAALVADLHEALPPEIADWFREARRS